jgi:hypothetical protein
MVLGIAPIDSVGKRMLVEQAGSLVHVVLKEKGHL